MQKLVFILFFIFMVNQEAISQTETATLGNGCFWCTEAIFSQLKGVISVESGYSGGKLNNPTYKDICTGETGHAEVIQLVFDPSKISFTDILEVFWQTHDPTTLNRQGADVGTQYRSVIFFHNEMQRKIASDIKNRLNSENVFGKPVVTEITKFDKFFKAEKYHQEYFTNNPSNSYCQFVIVPKVEKFRKVFKDKIK